MQNISYPRLGYFAEAVRAGAMRAASDTLNITPSSISRQIAALEDAVHFGLVFQTPHDSKIHVRWSRELLIKAVVSARHEFSGAEKPASR